MARSDHQLDTCVVVVPLFNIDANGQNSSFRVEQSVFVSPPRDPWAVSSVGVWV